MTGALYICPEHPELGWLSDRDWTRHQNDGKHPTEMRVRTRYPKDIRDGELGWTQNLRMGAAPTTHAGWNAMMRGVLGR